MKSKLRQFVELYLAFLKIGAFTFGGGLAMMPIMQRELIEKRGWLTDEELIDYFAIGQSTPGIIAVNVATFVGYKRLGVLGGIIGTLGVVTPSWVIIMILAGAISSVDKYPVAQKALKGINVAVAALLTSVIVKFSKKTIKSVWNAVLMLTAFALIYFFKVQSVWIIIASLVIGCLITMYKQKKAAKAVGASDTEKEAE
ncbi:chromate transporter [Treponema bryantii]|uniref:Chromate transporter n=1 Tax=Treponema bryantii TaxID=163 RepID=A0A1I3M448_9SPIR|nr:chromate transporter [Treponema bryantii]SFI91791.1 chromate transporter [Treponema bryantii]